MTEQMSEVLTLGKLLKVRLRISVPFFCGHAVVFEI